MSGLHDNDNDHNHDDNNHINIHFININDNDLLKHKHHLDIIDNDFFEFLHFDDRHGDQHIDVNDRAIDDLNRLTDEHIRSVNNIVNDYY